MENSFTFSFSPATTHKTFEFIAAIERSSGRSSSNSPSESLTDSMLPPGNSLTNRPLIAIKCKASFKVNIPAKWAATNSPML